MPAAVRFGRTGGPDVMTLEETNEQTPGPGEAWIAQEAIGVNYLDVTQRKGAVPIPLPSGLGFEGAGRVTRPHEVTNFKSCHMLACHFISSFADHQSGKLWKSQQAILSIVGAPLHLTPRKHLPRQ